jgi:hypothetical protein
MFTIINIRKSEKKGGDIHHRYILITYCDGIAWKKGYPHTGGGSNILSGGRKFRYYCCFDCLLSVATYLKHLLQAEYLHGFVAWGVGGG